MRSSAFLGACLLIFFGAVPVFAADDPLLKQAQKSLRAHPFEATGS